MILYPTTVVFRAAMAIERAPADLHAGRPMDPVQAMTRDESEGVLGKAGWAAIEKRAGAG